MTKQKITTVTMSKVQLSKDKFIINKGTIILQDIKPEPPILFILLMSKLILLQPEMFQILLFVLAIKFLI